ncbi:hypothetical protein J6590_057697, partial [Homalodisca vitripennis]
TGSWSHRFHKVIGIRGGQVVQKEVTCLTNNINSTNKRAATSKRGTRGILDTPHLDKREKRDRVFWVIPRANLPAHCFLRGNRINDRTFLSDQSRSRLYRDGIRQRTLGYSVH